MQTRSRSCRRWQLLMQFFSFFVPALFCFYIQAQAQTATNVEHNKEVRGTVTDSAAVPIQGVNIRVKDNPKIGTSTDVNGKFILDVPDTAVLIFTMVGFGQQEISVVGREVITISLQPSTGKLDDVVVVAFGKQKKSDVIGSVTSVRPADLKIPASNLTTAMAGQIAGMVAYQRSGEPGQDNADFFIRGVTTFGYKKDPLILLDGVEISRTDLARLQVDDIASFSIMKDATATALYGARGANGVILITTKEGKEGKMNITMRAETSVSSNTRNVELADPVTYMKLGNEAVLTRDPLGIRPYSQNKIDNTIAGTNEYVYPTTDWQDEMFKDYTFNQRFNLNASGGGKVARYYLAGTYNQDNGNLKVNGKNNFNNNINLKSYSLRANININLTSSTEATVRLYGSFDDYNGPIYTGTEMYNKVMHANPVLFPAVFPADEAHAHVKHPLFGNFGTAQYLNPYADMVKGYKEYSRSKIDAQFEMKQDLAFFTKGLAGRILFNTSRYSYFDVSRSYNPFFYSIGSFDKLSGNYQLAALNETSGTEYLGYSEGLKDVSSTTYLEAALNYNRTFGKKNDVSATVVYIMRNSLVGNAGDLQSSLPFRNAGVSSRVTYSYSSKYFAEFNFGYNGSERFYKNHRFGFFPSAGVAWTVSREKFWDPISAAISKLKLRATYGLVGNDAIGSNQDRFFYLSNVNMDAGERGAVFGTNNSYSRTGVLVSRYSNIDITWEKALKTNIGFEMSLFQKLDIEADYFTERRSNILMDRANIPSTMGLSSTVRANVGEASSHGIDGSIVYSEFFGKNFWLKARANFTYAESQFEVVEEPQYTERYLSRVGYSLSQQWGYIAERLFIDDKEVANSPRQNFGVYGAGDIKYRDVNRDGQITALDRVPIGYPTDPEIIYGFGGSMGYKNIDLSFFFQGSARSSFWIDAAATAPFNNETQLLKAYADSYWSEDNRNSYALWPRLSPTLSWNNTLLNTTTGVREYSTWFMREGSFLRLKSVELGYTLSRTALKKLNLSNARFYVNGLNLLSVSAFKMWDVEMGGNGLGYPIQRVFNAGILVGL